MDEVTSLTLVLPQEVETDSVACPPAFSILWKASNKIVSSSPIFSSESEPIKKLQELGYKRPFTFVVSTQLPIKISFISPLNNSGRPRQEK